RSHTLLDLTSFPTRRSSDLANAIRKVKLTEPSLKQTQSNYQNAADWLAQWKATLINDLNARTYNGAVVASDTQYSGIAGASAEKDRKSTRLNSSHVASSYAV